MENQLTHIILFDGVCNLCNSSVQFIIRHDKKNRFRFASLQSDFGQNQLIKYQIDSKNTDSFIYIKSDHAYIKSTAGLLVLKDLGGLWKLPFLFIVFPKTLRDWIYDLIAKNRYKLFGKKESCMVPTPDLKSRFIN
jgi:predicted DCC family thiol-disulfide oxidoreductase YuxK